MKNKKIIITLIGIIMVVIFAFKGMQIYKAIQIKNSIKLSNKTQTVNIGNNLYEKLPELSFKDENNKIVNLKDKKGKTLVITFWNSKSYDACEQVRAFYVLRETFKKYENTECIIVDNMDDNETKEEALKYLNDKNIKMNNRG